jgi:hypothetical protein
MDFMIETPHRDGHALPTDRTVLRSPQYGPAWVADCYGTTHEERIAVILAAEMGDGVARVSGDDPDQVAVAWARLVTNDGEDAAIGVTDWMPVPEEDEPRLVTSSAPSTEGYAGVEGPADRPVRLLVNDEDWGCW